MTPLSPAAWRNAAREALAAGQLPEAESCCREALELDPGDAKSLHLLGTTLIRQSRYEKAGVALQAASDLQPGDWRIVNDLGTVYRESGHHHEAAACFERLFRNPATPTRVLSNALLSLHGQAAQDHQRMFALIRAVGRRIEAEAGPPLGTSFDAIGDPKIRLGYCSPRLKPGVIGDFFLPLFDAHDRTLFDLYLYSDLDSSDNPCARYLARHADRWTDTRNQSDREMAETVRADRIDIFIDLAGHTPGNRLGVFARRPAPIQLSMLDSFDTTGMSAFDYFVSDQYASPPGSPQRFIEKLLLLHRPRLLWRPWEPGPEVSPLPALNNGYVTFGNFNRVEKTTEAALRAWAEILLRVSDSRLVLKARIYDDPDVVSWHRSQLVRFGVAPERIDFSGWCEHPHLLEAYGDIDIALDPFPYNGGLTACEAMWMGVPVLTLEGTRVISRQSASLLRSLRLESFVAGTLEDYVDRAVHWSDRLDDLANLRAGLRETLAHSAIMDAQGYASEFEQHLIALAIRHDTSAR